MVLPLRLLQTHKSRITLSLNPRLTHHLLKPSAPSPRAEAYYNYAMGHLFEQQYETTNQPEFATQAIDAYKKAYALDPKSPVIGERLAEMYWKAQRSTKP